MTAPQRPTANQPAPQQEGTHLALTAAQQLP